jgi:hypothetical protein
MPKRIEHLNARPSDDDRRRQQCAGKQRFATQSEANTIAGRSKRRHAGQKRCLEVYRCRWCQGWHVGQGLRGARLLERRPRE